MYFGVFRCPLSREKKKGRSPIPQLPFVSVFPETSQGNSAKRHRLRGPSPPSPPHPSARAWRLAAAVARARGTVREVRARAAFACAGEWGGSLSQWTGSPPPTVPSSSRASAFGEPRVPGGRGMCGGVPAFPRACAVRPRAFFFFRLAGGGLLYEKRVWGPPWSCPFLNPQSSVRSESRTGGRLNKAQALGSDRVALVSHPHAPVPCSRGSQWIG